MVKRGNDVPTPPEHRLVQTARTRIAQARAAQLRASLIGDLCAQRSASASLQHALDELNFARLITSNDLT
jgi:hypothetical protein